MAWWIWMIGAIVLAGVEVLIPGWVFLGFAIGGMLTGLALLLFPSLGGTAIIWLLFALLSLAGWLLLRRLFGRRSEVKIWKRDINDN
ncbi:hypothetical protein CG51_06140 [Haematobacter missouriensis]|nr:hypothetical protein CG51_06140 [Haematobacter missouriensis]